MTTPRPVKPALPRFPLLLGCAFLLIVAGCTRDREYPYRPITLICPWGAGGGTDAVSRQMAAHLEQELGVPVNVVNATGGKGVTGHGRGRYARPDGYTITTITLELNMMHHSGLTNLTYKDYALLASVNEDYAALFVRSDAPWRTLAELEQEIREKPGKLTASGTASGGAWHLAVAGWLLAAGFNADDVKWVSSEGASSSLLELMSGGVDIVCCSLPEAATQLENGDVRALGVMSPVRAADYPDVPTFIEQGRDWTLGGWRGLAVPRETPPEIVDKLVAAVEKVVTGQTTIQVSRTDDNGRAETIAQTFPEFMRERGFDNTFRGPEEFRAFVSENDKKFGELLTSEDMQSVNRDRYQPLAFPGALAALIVLVLIALAAQWAAHIRADKPSESASPHPPLSSSPHQPRITPHGLISFALVIVGIAFFPLLGETVGFLLFGVTLLFVLLTWLGTRIWISGLICIMLVPLVYELFAVLLRVPLPLGFWG